MCANQGDWNRKARKETRFVRQSKRLQPEGEKRNKVREPIKGIGTGRREKKQGSCVNQGDWNGKARKETRFVRQSSRMEPETAKKNKVREPIKGIATGKRSMI